MKVTNSIQVVHSAGSAFFLSSTHRQVCSPSSLPSLAQHLKIGSADLLVPRYATERERHLECLRWAFTGLLVAAATHPAPSLPPPILQSPSALWLGLGQNPQFPCCLHSRKKFSTAPAPGYPGLSLATALCYSCKSSQCRTKHH